MFTIARGRVVPDPDLLAIPAFKVLYERDKSKDKEKATNDLAYVYFMVDYRSPYRRSLTGDELKVALGQSLYKDDNFKPDKDIVAAMKAYEELQENQALKLLNAAEKATNALRGYLDQVDFTAVDAKGNQKFKMSEVLSAIKGVGDIVIQLQKLRVQVEKQQAADIKIRGGGSKGRREDPKK